MEVSMISFKNSLHAGLLLLGLAVSPFSAMNSAISDEETAEFNKMLIKATNKSSFSETKKVMLGAIEAGATSDQILKILTDREDGNWVALMTKCPTITRFLLEIASTKLSKDQFFQFISACNSFNSNVLFCAKSGEVEKLKYILDFAIKILTQDQFFLFFTQNGPNSDSLLTGLVSYEFIRSFWGDSSWSDSSNFAVFFNMIIEAALTRLTTQQFKEFFCATNGSHANPLCIAAEFSLSRNNTDMFETILKEAVIFLNPEEFRAYIYAKDDSGHSVNSGAKNRRTTLLKGIVEEAFVLNQEPEREKRALSKKTTIQINRIKKANAKIAARIAFFDRIEKKNERQEQISSYTIRQEKTQRQTSREMVELGEQIMCIVPNLAQNAIQ